MATITDMAYASFVRTLVIPIVGKIALRRGYHAKLVREADDVVSDGPGNRILIGRGILRDHAGTDVLGGFALCGVPVKSWSGGLPPDVQCHLCQEAMESAERRRSRSHHPAGRNRTAAALPGLRARCDD